MKRTVATMLCALGLCGLLAGCGSPAPQATPDEMPKTERADTTPSLPEDSVLVFFEDDEGVAKLVADMDAGRVPKSCTALYDQMGALPSVTISDEAGVREMYELVSNIRVLGESGMSMTDSYHFVFFELQDGTVVGFRFEGAGNLVRPGTSYYVQGDAAIWEKVRALQSGTTDKN